VSPRERVAKVARLSWADLSAMQKAAAVIAAVFLAGVTTAVKLSGYGPLPSQVRALRAERDSLLVPARLHALEIEADSSRLYRRQQRAVNDQLLRNSEYTVCRLNGNGEAACTERHLLR